MILTVAGRYWALTVLLIAIQPGLATVADAGGGGCAIAIQRGRTTDVHGHLKNHHPMEHAAYCQAKSSAMDGQKLQDSLKRKDFLPQDSERFRKITELIVECIAEVNQPVSFVENAAAIFLVIALFPSLSCVGITLLGNAVIFLGVI